MPIFKISSALKNADVSMSDKSAICDACEYPATEDNPIISLGMTKDGKREMHSHIHCKPAQDRMREQEELMSRDSAVQQEGDHLFSFANKFRYFATAMSDNSTVQETFPDHPQSNQKVEDMTTKQVDANYENGAPVPPKN